MGQFSSKTRLTVSLTCHSVLRNFIQNLPYVFPTKFQLIWPNGFIEKIFFNWPTTTRIAYGGHGNSVPAKRFQRSYVEKFTNQKQEVPMAAMFISVSWPWEYEQSLYRTFFFSHICFLSVHLAKQFQRRFVRNLPIWHDRSSNPWYTAFQAST